MSYQQKQKSKLKNKCIIRYHNNHRVNWDLFIIVLAIYNSIFLPLEIAFKPHFLQTDLIVLVNHMIDAIFGIDIFISFRTTYVDSRTGDEQLNPQKIAMNYFLGKFWFDLLSTIPFEGLVLLIPNIDTDTASNFVVISCLKLIRILRLSRLINYLNSSHEFKLQLRLSKLCFLLFLYIHVTACFFYFMSEWQNTSKNG